MKYPIASKRLVVVYLACSALLLLGAGSVQAQELVAAKILSVEGPVEIRRPANNQPQLQQIAFKPSDELRAGDTIITGRKGRLVLSLSDGSQAVIAAQTTVVIKDLSQSPRTLFHVLRGKTRLQIEKLGGRPNPYRVHTPTAVIAVRGTIFDVLVEDDQTQVFLHEGEVAVTSLRWPEQPIFLTAGQTIRIRLQRPLSNPGSFKAGRNDGNFKSRRDESRSEETRRSASSSGGRSESERGSLSGDNRERSAAGRANNRGGPSMNGSRSNDGSRGGGRRP